MTKLQGAASQALARNEPGPIPCSRADLKHTGTQLINIHLTVKSLIHAIVDRGIRDSNLALTGGADQTLACLHRPSSERQNPTRENPSTIDLNCPPAGMSWFSGVTPMMRSQGKSSEEPLSRDTIRKDSDPQDIHTQRNLRNQAAGPQFSSKAT